VVLWRGEKYLPLPGIETWTFRVIYLKIQDAAGRTPLFEKRINSKSKKILQMFCYFWKEHNAVLHQCVLKKTSLKWRP